MSLAFCLSEDGKDTKKMGSVLRTYASEDQYRMDQALLLEKEIPVYHFKNFPLNRINLCLGIISYQMNKMDLRLPTL
jgi:hypothetical protein